MTKYIIFKIIVICVGTALFLWHSVRLKFDLYQRPNWLDVINMHKIYKMLVTAKIKANADAYTTKNKCNSLLDSLKPHYRPDKDGNFMVEYSEEDMLKIRKSNTIKNIGSYIDSTNSFEVDTLQTELDSIGSKNFGRETLRDVFIQELLENQK